MINLDSSRIIVPFNFTITGERAIKYAARLAKESSGVIYLLHIQKTKDALSLLFSDGDKQSEIEAHKLLRSDLNSFAEKMRSEFSIRVVPVLAKGNIPKTIIKTAQKYNAGLIIMGTDGSDSVSSLLRGSNAYRVLSKSEIPVLTVRHEPANEIRKILLPVDSSRHTKQKVNLTIKLARKLKLSIHILGLTDKDEEGFIDRLRLIISQIRQIAAESEVKCTSEILLAGDRALKTMLIAKKTEAGMIVTMTDQSESWARSTAGTYDHQLINESEIPVLSIPPEIHDENIEPASIAGS